MDDINDDINTEELQVTPRIVNNDEEYTHTYKRMRKQYLILSASEYNGKMKFFIASTIKEDDNADIEIIRDIELPREEYLWLRRFVNHPEVMRRFGL